MSDFTWFERPAVIAADAPANDLRVAAQKNDAILIRDALSNYYAYQTAALRIKPWFVKLSRLRTGRVTDYVDLTLETPAALFHEDNGGWPGADCVVEADETGAPLRVGFRVPHRSPLLPSDMEESAFVYRGQISGVIDVPPAPEAGVETVSIIRYPSIEPSTTLSPGIEVDFMIDLPSTPPNGVPDPDFISIAGLPADWQKAEIDVEIASGYIDFKKSSDQIVLQRDGTSLACKLHGKVSLACTPGQEIPVVVTFLMQRRVCGMVRRTYTLGQASPVPAGIPMSLDLDAPPPVLTVRILGLDAEQSGRFLWLALIPRGLDIPGLPLELKGEINVGADPASFIRAEFPKLAGLKPGEHMISFHAFGDLLWKKSPAFFQKTYWALRKQLGDHFAIQFISDDPNIPWELMRPGSDDDDVETELLAMSHPVARWLGDSQGSLRYHLPPGKIATIAPEYPKPNDRLERAQTESKLLQTQYSAVPVEGTFKGVWDLLTKGLNPGPVSVVHFAGHGNFSMDSAVDSGLQLQDRTLTVLQVGSRDVKLGKTHCLVVCNACDAGSLGSLLGGTGGWADTILQQGFGGFIAPLWWVNDSDAVAVAASLFDDLVNRRIAVSEALLSIRKKYGAQSPTYLAYLFYGDVEAKIGA